MVLRHLKVTATLSGDVCEESPLLVGSVGHIDYLYVIWWGG